MVEVKNFKLVVKLLEWEKSLNLSKRLFSSKFKFKLWLRSLKHITLGMFSHSRMFKLLQPIPWLKEIPVTTSENLTKMEKETDLALVNGKMVRNTKVIGLADLERGKESSNREKAQYMMECGTKTSDKELENWPIKVGTCLKALGTKID